MIYPMHFKCHNDPSVGKPKIEIDIYLMAMIFKHPNSPQVLQMLFNHCSLIIHQQRDNELISEAVQMEVNVRMCILYIYINMGVSKNTDTPKWMVYNGKPY